MKKTPAENSRPSKSGSCTRRGSPLEEQPGKRLTAYALAAGAAGVGLLALAQPAQADIVYRNDGLDLNNYPSGTIDLNRDGIPDFAASGSMWCGDIYPLGGHVEVCGARLLFRGYGYGNGVLPGPQAAGAVIGPQGNFTSATGVQCFYTGGNATNGGSKRETYGLWANVSGYMGFRFSIDGQFHYGWANFSTAVSNNNKNSSGYFGGYAYNTVANQSIVAGQTSATPEPGTLGLLALGSLGLGFWRRRKQGPVPSSQLPA